MSLRIDLSPDYIAVKELKKINDRYTYSKWLIKFFAWANEPLSQGPCKLPLRVSLRANQRP